jgi:cytochrome c-type biogenesis protein CcmH
MRAFFLTLILATSAFAQTTLNPGQQARAHALYKEIRCPTCVAQSLAESEAQLSQDLRNRIDSLIIEGQTDEEIRNTLAASYGDDIRLRPKAEARTMIIWLAPWAILLIGGGAVLSRRRRR